MWKCLLDAGQWPDRLKNDAPVQKDMFLAKHILFEVPHHVTNYIHFYRLGQPATRRM